MLCNYHSLLSSLKNLVYPRPPSRMTIYHPADSPIWNQMPAIAKLRPGRRSSDNRVFSLEDFKDIDNSEKGIP